MAIMGASLCTALFLFLFSVDSMFLSNVSVQGKPNYKEALEKSILFFKGQRSGRIPTGGDQQIDWRSDSGLSDGSLAGVDLTGGYYDAGDNVKFNIPMAFTTTMLSWSAMDYRKTLGPELENAQTAIRWATDYLLKCAKAMPGKLYVGVGEPNADHRCWERPEDMDTPRNVYSVSASNPGSDVAAETAAALAAASMVFRKDDAKYSKLLLKTAKKVMKFAKKYRGAYSGKLCPFYCSVSGYKDELLWGAAWLYRATKKARYLNLIEVVATNDTTDLFSWDNKFAGARVLLAREFLVKNKEDFELFKQQAEEFMCRILPNSPSSSTEYTPGGLMYKLSAVNLQYVTSISFLLSTYSKYMASTKHTFNCGKLVVKRHTLRKLAKKQVDYILGVNPLNMSYMVGFGENFPKRIHHRGSSLPSKASQPQSLGCDAGYQFFHTADPNPNILVGAIVGGPFQNDSFPDNRSDSGRSEPTTYTNAAIVGPLAHLAWNYFK